jgi:hypothetical protein
MEREKFEGGSLMKSKYSPTRMKPPKKLLETRNLINHQTGILNENRIVLYKKGK